MLQFLSEAELGLLPTKDEKIHGQWGNEKNWKKQIKIF